MGNPPDKQQIRDLLNAAHVLYLEYKLPGARKDGRANDLIARLSTCATSADSAGDEPGARSLRHAAQLLAE
jgi:hypothetical protein